MNVITQFPAAYEYDHDLRFRAIFEGAAIGIGICRLDGQIFETNAALSRMLGYSQPELLRARAEELYPDLRRDSSKDNGDGNGERNGNDEGDGNAPQIYSGTLSLDQRLLAELMRGERDSFDAERPFRRKDGSHLWGHLTVSLGRDDRRQPAFLIATLTDATERRQVEEHLREAEKMEVIGRLAGGIAHDFNNLLTGILLYCDLLSTGLENSATHNGNGKSNPSAKDQVEPCELCHHVEEVRRAGEQGAAITQQLLAIARKQAAEPRLVAINEVVVSTENLLRRLIGEQVELVLELDPALNSATEPAPADSPSLVLADPAQLRQVLMNLVLNARDAMPQGGRITISTRQTELPHAPHEVSDTGAPRGSRRAISMVVTDDGCGMAPETRARLFEPFFTTKRPGEGTGLGLATVQRIVSESGGSIAVQSDAGCGTRIEIALPAVAPSSNVLPSNLAVVPEFEEKSGQKPPNEVNSRESQELQKKRGEHPRTNCKTILLVDDNAPARQSMGRILLDAGYQILEASNGKQALILTEQTGAPDLLIADCMMPTMSGQEIAEALLRKHNQLKVILISGFENPPLGSAAAAVEMIRKPFSGTALLDRVLEVLGS